MITYLLYDGPGAVEPQLTIKMNHRTLALQLLENEEWVPTLDDLDEIKACLSSRFPSLEVFVISGAARIQAVDVETIVNPRMLEPCEVTRQTPAQECLALIRGQPTTEGVRVAGWLCCSPAIRFVATTPSGVKLHMEVGWTQESGGTVYDVLDDQPLVLDYVKKHRVDLTVNDVLKDVGWIGLSDHDRWPATWTWEFEATRTVEDNPEHEENRL